MNPASVDIKDILEAESALGLTFSANLFIGREPAKPDFAVTIWDTPGGPPDMGLGGQSDPGYYYPAVHIRVRAVDYLTAYNTINQIKLLLHGRGNEVINSTRYTSIRCSAEPHFHDWDDSNRCRFVAGFNLQRTIL